MAGKDRQRQLAREKVQRQMARRAAQARRQRLLRNIAVVAVVVVVVAAGVAYGVIKLAHGSSAKKKPPVAAPPPTTAMCTYTRPQQSAAPARKVQVPSITGIPRSGTAVVKLVTNRGTIQLTLDQAKAPCTTHNFVSLLQQKYFDNTPCHRLTTKGLYVLQCGDPTGKGTGGPGYVFPDENLPTAGNGQGVYKAGTVAMANGGPGTNGSQFFLVYKDSPLPPSYSVFGTITGGLPVIDKIAKAGAVGSTGDGKPKLPVTITKATLVSGGQNADESSATPTPSGSTPGGSGSPSPTGSRSPSAKK